jgi:hypothetical protein
VVLVGLPSAITAAGSKPEPAAEPAKGALTIRLEGDAGGAEPEYVRVAAPAPTPAKPIALADAEGLRTASATPSDDAGCAAALIRHAGLVEGPDPWCLKIESVDIGYELKGTTAPATPELALSVTRRPLFTERPLVVAIAGLICGFLVLLLPVNLRALIKETLLWRLLERNRTAEPEEKIEGLETWVQESRKLSNDAATILGFIGPVVKRGPTEARAKRAKLLDAVKGSSVAATHPYRVAATNVAETPTHKIGDFLKADGTPATHPADTWETGLEGLEEVQKKLESEKQRIEDTIKDEQDCRKVPLAKLKTATDHFGAIADPDHVDDDELKALMVRLRDAITAAAEDFHCSKGVAEASGAAAGLKALVWPVGEALPKVALVSVLALGAALTLLACLVVSAFAIANVYATVYIPKPAFGTCADYFALFTAALASGAAVAVVGFLGYWREGDEEAA